jgi:hypothetical protein
VKIKIGTREQSDKSNQKKNIREKIKHRDGKLEKIGVRLDTANKLEAGKDWCQVGHRQ